MRYDLGNETHVFSTLAAIEQIGLDIIYDREKSTASRVCDGVNTIGAKRALLQSSSTADGLDGAKCEDESRKSFENHCRIRDYKEVGDLSILVFCSMAYVLLYFSR